MAAPWTYSAFHLGQYRIRPRAPVIFRMGPLLMNSPLAELTSPFSALPQPFQDGLRARLLDNEQVSSWLQLDLDSQLNFSAGWLVLTTQRLLSWEPGSRLKDQSS